MSRISTRAQSSLYKSVLASEVELDPQISSLGYNLSYPFGMSHEKLPGPLPPLPDWMLDTPMYSKLPMVPAPKGKIVLFTTSLCKKLHQTPDDLDFDPVASGLCCEYKSLHDPHLKSHYTRQVTYDRLIRSGYITSDGMVKCSLKEFNDYHQYLKSVRLEKITQERKRMLLEERERLSRERKQSIQKDVSERDRMIKESLVKQKKVRDRERKKLSRKLQNDYRKTMMRLVEQRRTKMVQQQKRRKASEEKHHAIRTYLETEDRLKKVIIKAKRTAEEMRRADLMKLKRKKEKEEKERKLEDQWSRREEARAQRMLREKTALAQKKEEMFQKIERREEKVARHREKQQDIFVEIREERNKKTLSRELAIATQLEKRIQGLCRKYTTGPKRGKRRFPLITQKMTTDMTTWNITDKQKAQKQRSSSDTKSMEKLPPIISSDESGSSMSRKRSGPPSLAIFETSSLPSVKYADLSKEIVTIVEQEPSKEVLSTGDAPVSLPEVLDSFTAVARRLVSAVFKDLREDPEFETVDWDDAGRPESPDIYIDASEVSPQASLMVANALKTALNQLAESQPTLVKVITLEDKAKAVVSSIIENSLKSLLPFSHIELVENKPASVDADDSGQRLYQVDERLAGRSEDNVTLSSIIEMFQPPGEAPSITHTDSSSEESEANEDEDDAVIGIVENPILMDEIEHAGGPSGDMDVDEGLHVVMHKAQDGHLVVDGAVLTAEHENQTITERILSNITLERASGSLSGASSSRSALAREEATVCSSSEDEGEEIIPEDHSSIVPIYQKNLVNLSGDLVKSHLSAISMKPESDGKLPGRGQCAARNSFRNIFRPDMTYCQGSARMLRDTLVTDIKSRQAVSLPSGMDAVYEVLEKEEQDIMEKHSDEALVTVEETEGLCYLPPRKKKPPPVPSETPPAALIQQTESQPDDGGLPTQTSQVPPSQSKEAVEVTSINADVTDGDNTASLEEESAKAASTVQISTEQTMDIVPVSKSAMETRERALSAEKRSTKHEVSAQSVDASPNLAGSDKGSTSSSGSGEESSAHKHVSRRAKKVTRSSSVISSVMSRLSHVFSGSRRKSNASVPSHESSSEPASRQSSKKSVEGITGGALSEGAQTQDGTPSDEANIAGSDAQKGDSAHQDGSVHIGTSVHHGASVHFTSMTIDPPVKKQSIYESHHRPQTPIPHVHIDVDEEEDDEEELEVTIDEGDGDSNPPCAQPQTPIPQKHINEESEVIINEGDEKEEAVPVTAEVEEAVPAGEMDEAIPGSETEETEAVPTGLGDGDVPPKVVGGTDPIGVGDDVPTGVMEEAVPTGEVEQADPIGLDDAPSTEVEENVLTVEEATTGVTEDAVLPPEAEDAVATDVMKEAVPTGEVEEAVPAGAVDKDVPAAVVEGSVSPAALEDGVVTGGTEHNVHTGVVKEDIPAVVVEDSGVVERNVPVEVVEDSLPIGEVALDTDVSSEIPPNANPTLDAIEKVNNADPSSVNLENTVSSGTEHLDESAITDEGLTKSDPQVHAENGSNNAQTDGASNSVSRLPSIQTSHLQPHLESSKRTSSLSQSRDGATPSVSRASQGSRLMPPPGKLPSERSLSGAQSMTITGRSLAPVVSKAVKSVTSAERKEKHHPGGEISPRSPSSGRGTRVGLSHHRRVSSPQKRSSASSQSASKVKDTYGNAAALSISGCQILPSKPSHSPSSSSTRRSSRTHAGLISATELGSTRGSRSKTGSRGSVVMPRPPSGSKPSGSAQSGHRVVRHPSGAQAMSNPTLTTGKGSSSTLVNHRSSEKLLKRRPSLEKENRMERLSTESVSSRRSSKEKVVKKKSSGTQSKEEESLQEQKPGTTMPPIKESLTPRPPTHPRQKSRPSSGVKKETNEAGQKSLVLTKFPLKNN